MDTGPGMKRDIQTMVQCCEECLRVRQSFSRSVHSWPKAAPRERWHMDWTNLGIIYLLIKVDAGTRWIEAFLSNNQLSNMVIHFLQTIFKHFGIPNCLVSDNAPEFVSEELNGWLLRQGVRKLKSPIYLL